MGERLLEVLDYFRWLDLKRSFCFKKSLGNSAESGRYSTVRHFRDFERRGAVSSLFGAYVNRQELSSTMAGTTRSTPAASTLRYALVEVASPCPRWRRPCRDCVHMVSSQRRGLERTV